MAQSKSHTAQSSSDKRHQDNGQGEVKDPAHDGRLKENRDKGVSKDNSKGK